METLRTALDKQHRAAIGMLRGAVEACTDEIWTSGQPHREFWRLAYHTLYYTHMYLEPSIEAFQPWEKHRDEVESPKGGEDPNATPYTQAEILEYCDWVASQVTSKLAKIDLDAAECGIPWYKMPKLDHLIVNIRHVQEHAGQLRDRLLEAGIDQRWIGQP